jgi:hypothetical protein
MLSYEDVEGAADWIKSPKTLAGECENNPAAGQRQYRAEDVERHRWMFAQVT